MVAEPVGALVEGRAALAFDLGAHLVLEERSGRALELGTEKVASGGV
jgi:hypothetical protein